MDTSEFIWGIIAVIILMAGIIVAILTKNSLALVVAAGVMLHNIKQ